MDDQNEQNDRYCSSKHLESDEWTNKEGLIANFGMQKNTKERKSMKEKALTVDGEELIKASTND